MLYLKKFETTSQYEEYISSDEVILPNVSYCEDADSVYYHPFHDYSKDYLTFISSSDNNVIGWKAVQQSGNNPIRTISYSTDKTNWTSVASTTAGVTLATLNSGDKLYLKGTENTYGKFYQGFSWSQFTSSGQFTAEGNIMSLIGGDNFSGLTSFTSSNESAFLHLFNDCTSLIDISNLILPALNLADYCYYYMFNGCTSLTTAPELPATTLATYCYYYMFNGCTSLTTAPELPATTLATYCYSHMFNGCTSLTTAPVLSATTLADYCCYYMFNGCTNLTTAPVLHATMLAFHCYNSMFSNTNALPDCSNIDFSSQSVLASGGLIGLFAGTKITDAQLDAILKEQGINDYSLPATTLEQRCYNEMFRDCTSLTTAPELPATTLAQNCYDSMFYGCTSLTTAPELPATTLANYCYNGMFKGCTSLTTAPVLPATTLAQSCYNQMFYGCTSLNSIKCLATNIRAANCTGSWVRNVASSGTFTKAASMSSWTTGNNGIPSGWSVVDAE